MHIRKGMTLIEVVISMIVLAIAALGVAATVITVNSEAVRTAAGSSIDLQALSYAKETLESLRNAVSTDATTSASLLDTSYTPPCTAAQSQLCGGATGGTTYTPAGVGTSGLPASDLQTRGGQRRYRVFDVSSGTGAIGTDVAYKKVIVTVDGWPDA